MAPRRGERPRTGPVEAPPSPGRSDMARYGPGTDQLGCDLVNGIHDPGWASRERPTALASLSCQGNSTRSPTMSIASEDCPTGTLTARRPPPPRAGCDSRLHDRTLSPEAEWGSTTRPAFGDFLCRKLQSLRAANAFEEPPQPLFHLLAWEGRRRPTVTEPLQRL